MPTGVGPVLGTSHVPATCHFRPTSGANAVTARTFLARGEATPGHQQSRGQGGFVKPLLAYALGSLLAASSRKPAQEIRARNAQFGTVRNRATAARERSQETAQPSRTDAEGTGRGRTAKAPWEIPWKGWKDILWRTYAEVGKDRLLAVAAGVVFYGLLALFPAITAIVSLYGFFAQASGINEHLSLIAGLLPGGAVEIIQEQVTRIVSKGETRLTFAFALGLALALWSANAGMKALIDALNVSYDEQEKRGFVKLNLVSLALTAGAIVAILIAVGAVVVVPVVLSYLGLGGWVQTLLSLLRWPVLLVLVIIGLAVLYRFGPSREHARWQWISIGSLVAAVSWLISSALLSWYLASFANYDATYGSLGAAIGMMMWMWISSIVILFGAELNSEVEHQTARDTTTGREEPLGDRGAKMADTVGAAKS
jgi:membrane protein